MKKKNQSKSVKIGITLSNHTVDVLNTIKNLIEEQTGICVTYASIINRALNLLLNHLKTKKEENHEAV